MDKNTRKLFSELKKTCNTKAKRKAYNNLVKSFSDEDPTPEQKGIIEYLKGWVLEHPGEAKYLVELGEKWGVDNLLEGLNYDNEDHEAKKTFARKSKLNDIGYAHDAILTFILGLINPRGDKPTNEVKEYLMKVKDALNNIK